MGTVCRAPRAPQEWPFVKYLWCLRTRRSADAAALGWLDDVGWWLDVYGWLILVRRLVKVSKSWLVGFFYMVFVGEVHHSCRLPVNFQVTRI